ncbi:MAG: hypothetical protein KF906_06620 [Actinobacteria bacterium]|nr:hypothetical protein [Actinomycetota bacterium]
MAMLEDPPFDLLCPGRRPTGIGPVLLPADEADGPDWDGFAHLLGRVADTRLLPGVNLGPGGGEGIDATIRAEVLATTGAALAGEPFVAGVRAEPGADGGFDPSRLAGAVQSAARHHAVPLLLPSPALDLLDPDELVALVAWTGDWCERLLVAEAPAGPPEDPGWGMDVFGALLSVDHCIGVVHGSRRRQPEWDRIRRRDDQRSGFQVFSANDRAVDQVMYGADHCLDVSAAVPDLVEARDDAWEAESPDALEQQDALQALSSLVARAPSAGTRHAVARLLHLRGWLPHDRALGAPLRRPPGDDDVLRAALDRLGL